MVAVFFCVVCWSRLLGTDPLVTRNLLLMVCLVSAFRLCANDIFFVFCCRVVQVKRYLEEHSGDNIQYIWIDVTCIDVSLALDYVLCAMVILFRSPKSYREFCIKTTCVSTSRLFLGMNSSFSCMYQQKDDLRFGPTPSSSFPSICGRDDCGLFPNRGRNSAVPCQANTHRCGCS